MRQSHEQPAIRHQRDPLFCWDGLSHDRRDGGLLYVALVASLGEAFSSYSIGRTGIGRLPINTVYGHGRANRALRCIALRARAVVRQSFTRAPITGGAQDPE